MHDARDAEDKRLLEAGDHKTLLAGYFDQVVGRCYLRLRNEDAAHEAAQEIFLRLWRELRAGKTWTGLPFRVVVWQVTHYTLRGFYAGVKTDAELPDQFEGESADDAYAEWETENVLGSYFAELPDGQRVVCELRYLEGLEQSEIAERLEIEPNAVYQRLFNAHKKLRALARP